MIWRNCAYGLFFNQIKYIPDGFVAFCISKEVANSLKAVYPEFYFSVRVAKKPSLQEMCKVVVAASEFAD